MAECSVGDCSNGGKLRRGWCELHYHRWRKYGDVLSVLRPSPGASLRERLEFHGWDEVAGPLDTPCWEWRGGRTPKGYGQLGVFGTAIGVHRVSYEQFVGPIPPGEVVRHRCDNPPCINPQHLQLGTRGDNNRDRLMRGGPQNAKLDWSSVRAIRSSRATPREIARLYGVSQATIYLIRSNKIWKESDEKLRA